MANIHQFEAIDSCSHQGERTTPGITKAMPTSSCKKTGNLFTPYLCKQSATVFNEKQRRRHFKIPA